MPLASRLVLVPSSVQVPPNIDAYESGISSFEEAIPISRESVSTTGINTMTTGVLLIKAETAATPITIMNMKNR